MTVEELINELMATCQSLDAEVCVGDPGLVTMVGGATDGKVWLNDYPTETSGDS